MATLQYLMNCMICYSSLFSLFISFPIEASEIQYRTIHVMNINDVQTSGCNPTIGGPTKLEVTHPYGPCSPVKNQTGRRPSLTEILSHDQLRFDQIRARLKQSSSSVDSSNYSEESINNNNTLPANYDYYSSYIVRVGLGTPTQEQYLTLETASSELTWTRKFDPGSSDSYSDIPCGSTECKEFPYSKQNCEDDPTECDFDTNHSDGPGPAGTLSKETLTITTDHHDEVFPGFIFGINKNPSRSTQYVDVGVLGLGRGGESYSFLSQTAKTYGNIFRYCLPSNEGSTGYLAFGGGDANASLLLLFTPLIQQNNDNGFYFIEITSISVGGKKLDINPVVFQTRNTIIDSGTKITLLPTEAYTAMREAFKKMILEENNNYYIVESEPTTTVSTVVELDTCYYMTRGVYNISVPTIAFTFKGNVTVQLDHSGILYAVDYSHACLAFAVVRGFDDLVVFGTIQQRTYEVVYDVANERLGFRPNACN